MREPFGPDVRLCDLHPGDRLELHCRCGQRVGPATAHWPDRTKRVPLRTLQPRLKCDRCGARGPAMTVHVTGRGGEPIVLWELAGQRILPGH